MKSFSDFYKSERIIERLETMKESAEYEALTNEEKEYLNDPRFKDIPAEYFASDSLRDMAAGLQAHDVIMNEVRKFVQGQKEKFNADGTMVTKGLRASDMSKFYRNLYKEHSELRHLPVMKSVDTLRNSLIREYDDNFDNEKHPLYGQVVLNQKEEKMVGRDVAKAKAVIARFEKYRVEYDEAEQDPDDTVVVRTKDGTADVVFYKRLPSESMNQIKAAYGKLYGVNYYDTRPCLFKNWVNWDDKRKYASNRSAEE